MEKILTFIVKDHKLLLLLGSDNDPMFHQSFWYVVTGACERNDNSLEDTVRREVYEETGLSLNNVIDLNWVFEYECLGEFCVEHAFISYTDLENIVLNEESIDYKWCDINEFIDLIKWYGDKNKLRLVLEKYL